MAANILTNACPQCNGSPEEWRQVSGFKFYEVSNYGRVRSLDKPRIGQGGGKKGRMLSLLVRERVRFSGEKKPVHIQVNLCQSGTQIAELVHRLVLSAFVGSAPDGKEGCHNDGDATHNHLGNLRWDFPVGNHKDMSRHGTRAAGERHGLAKLTNADVESIRAARAAGEMTKSIATRYGVTSGHIRQIVSGRYHRIAQVIEDLKAANL